MSKLAIASIILLLAGIGLALGAAGSSSCAQTGCMEKCAGPCAGGEKDPSACICPNNTTCAKTGCMEKCAGPCAGGEKDPSACICPNNTTCAKTGCMEKCAGPCAGGAKDSSACICPNNTTCAKTGCMEKCAGSGSQGGNAAPSSAACGLKASQLPSPDRASCAINLAPSCTGREQLFR